MSALIGSLWPYLAAAGAALVVIWRILAGAKKAGVDQQKAKELQAREQARREELTRIKNAADAGARVQPLRPGVPNNDPYNLDQ